MLKYFLGEQNVEVAVVAENVVLNNQLEEVKNLIQQAVIVFEKIDIEYGEYGEEGSNENSSSDLDADLKNDLNNLYLKWSKCEN